MVAFASVANKQKHAIFHLHFSILKRGDRGGEEGGRGRERRVGIKTRERGHPGGHFGVRDMLVDCWSWLMETTVACLTHQSCFVSLCPGRGVGEEVVMGESTEEEGMMKSRYKRTSSWYMEEEQDLNLNYRNAIFV